MQPLIAAASLLACGASALAEPEPVALPIPEAVLHPAPAHYMLEKRQWSREQMYNKSSTTDCSDVHIIVDRATGEEPSQGIIGTLATLISERIPGTTVEWVDYPAVLVPYDQSTDTGIRMTKQAISNYADKCGNAKIVLLGYSQGAQVVGDVLCGGGGAIGLGPLTDPLEDQYMKRVVAAVQMGDPRFMPNQPWDAGTSNTGGVFPRGPDRTCDKVGDKIRSYCDQFDPFCSVPGLDYDLHASYNSRYNEDAFQFVQGKVKYAKTLTILCIPWLTEL